MTNQDISSEPVSPHASDATQAIKEDLGKVANEVQATAEDLKNEAVEQAAAIKDTAEAQFGEAAAKAKSLASDQKDQAADQLGGISGAVSRVADELGKDDQTSAVAGYARDLAGGIQRISETVKNNSVDDLIAMTEDFGRRQPIAFLGAAALAGFVASRFVLASAQRRQRPEPATSSDPAPSSPAAFGSAMSSTDASDGYTNGNRPSGSFQGGAYK